MAGCPRIFKFARISGEWKAEKNSASSSHFEKGRAGTSAGAVSIRCQWLRRRATAAVPSRVTEAFGIIVPFSAAAIGGGHVKSAGREADTRTCREERQEGEDRAREHSGHHALWRGACLRETPPLALRCVCWETKSARVTRGNALHGKFKCSLDNEAAVRKWEVA